MASEIEIRIKAMLKAYRSQVRLRYSIEADTEIARNVEEIKDKITEALARGETVSLKPAELTISGTSVEALTDGES